MEDAKPITIAEFLAWEARQTTDHELIEGVIVAMPTPKKAYGRLVRRLNRTIDAAVGDTCDVYLGDMTVRIEGLERDNAPRPDIVVTCDERDRRPNDEDDRTISWPKLVVEVLSPRTAAKDLVTRLRNYFSIPTVEEYLIVDSRARSVIVHRRTGEQVVTMWPDTAIELSSIDRTISLDDLYDGIGSSTVE